MYQMQSIISACNSKKQVRHWFENQSTKELLEEFEQGKLSGRILPDAKTYENRPRLSIALRGKYVHRLLVNAVAMWASPKYALYIHMMLDKLAEEQRERMEKRIAELTTERDAAVEERDAAVEERDTALEERDVAVEEQQKTETRIETMKPRLVPAGKDKSYTYMVWKDDPKETGEWVTLRVARRKRDGVYGPVKDAMDDPNRRLLYFKNLPVSVTLNEKVKDLIKDSFPRAEYRIQYSYVTILKKHLPSLLDSITQYVESFRN
jgi:hypothetical protein